MRAVAAALTRRGGGRIVRRGSVGESLPPEGGFTIKRLAFAAIGLGLVVLLSACGGGDKRVPASDEDALASRYVSEICKPFAKYVESYIQAMALVTEEAPSPDDLLEMNHRMKANSEATLAEFRAIDPPAAIRDVHERVITGLQAEIDGFEQLETALQDYMRTGSTADLERAMATADEALTRAGVGPAGLEFEDVPPEYLVAWERECVPRLQEIPGVEE
jgi:hypothetical protein